MGFDLGGTKMLATVYTEQFEGVGRKRRKTRGHEGVESGLRRIAETIEKACEEAGVSRKQLRGIGVGCPGPLDLDKGILFDAPNLGWENVELKKFLEKEFGCPATIMNDVDAGVYGEYRFGAAQDSRCVLGVFPGTGIGGGCVYEGQIIRGRSGSCMEFGHMRVLPDGPRCGCGQRGCLEAVASRLAISAAAAQAAYRGQAPVLMANEGTDLSDIRSGALADSVRGGDAVVERILRDAAGLIGVAVASVVHLISPDTVVLGGGLVEAMPKLFVECVTEAARESVMPAYRKTFKVVAASLGDDAAVMGAAAWVRQVAAAS